MPNDPRPPHYRALTAAAGTLAAVAGFVNAVTVAGPRHLPSTHMSGTTTRLTVDVVNDAARATTVFDLSLILMFVIGCSVSGAVLESTRFRVGRRYGVLLVVEAAILASAWQLMRAGSETTHIAVLALAAGLQNALATQYSGAIVRTTHVTGILSDIGIALGKWVARRGVSGWRVVLYLAIFGGFALGGVGGAAAWGAWGADALLVPIAITGLGGTIYWTLRQLAIRREASAREAMRPR